MKETKEEEIRAELEDITYELVQIDKKKKQTNIVEKNEQYKELCKRQDFLEIRKKNLLDSIKKLYEK